MRRNTLNSSSELFVKFIFMLLILFILTDPVLARPANNTSECLKMYGTYMNEYGASKFIPEAQMLNFIARCLPADTANRNDQQHQKLLQNITHDRQPATVKI